jgi:hypothetical protein
MATIQLPPDFSEFLKLLNENSVDYLLIGGLAVAYYGFPRSTGDMDIWVRADEKNASKVVDCLVEFGFGQPDLQPDLFTVPDRIVRFGVPPLRIEVMTSISGVEFDQCFENRKLVELEALTVPLIALDDLKINKRAAGRLKDLLDLENL